jgi:alkylation response protein AidB-like acyl-CoA dehydrogenase
MAEEKKTKYLTQAVNDQILEKLSLKNRYAFLNTNLTAMLEPNQFNYLKSVQKFCMRFEKKNNIIHGPDEDIYDWIPAFGKAGLISRTEAFEAIDLNYDPHGMVVEMLRCLALDFFDPQFAMGGGATVLAINPVKEHHDNVPVRLEALKEMVTGVTPGCILITEPERGSDAVHQLTKCAPQDDGSFILNGTKIFNTNAPKSKWAVVYGTTEPDNPNSGNLMGQFLVDTSWDGWHCDRVMIPWVPKLYLGKEELTNLRVPAEYVLGGIGKGREHLFEGLVPERIGIAMMSLAESWNAFVHAAIYANMREQMGKKILLHQGVGFLLTDMWAKVGNFTLGLLKFSEGYDSKMEKFGGELPKNISMALVASASQMKYQAAALSAEVCYEAANIMGGAGLSDNLLTHDLLGISRIQEIVGGSRQIQQYVLSMALRQSYKMSGL